MTNNTDDRPLEYLKLLLPQFQKAMDEYGAALRNFFLYSLIFFVLSQFQASELTLFGAKVNIPQDWISAIAPLVLTFYYLRSATLFAVQSTYESEAMRTSLEAFDRLPSLIVRAAKISDAIRSFPVAPMLENESRMGCSYGLFMAAAVVYGIALILAQSIIPIIIIVYFIWRAWTMTEIPASLLIPLSSASFLFSLVALIVSIYEASYELRNYATFLPPRYRAGR